MEVMIMMRVRVMNSRAMNDDSDGDDGGGGGGDE